MIRRRISFLGFRLLQVTLVAGCVMGLLSGCSSRLQTTTVSGTEWQKTQVSQTESEPMVVEEVTVQPIQEVSIPAVSAMDIPVEEPARPVDRPKLDSEIFATPRTPEVPSEMSVRSELEPSLPTQEDPVVSSLPLAPKPTIQPPAVGIPPIAFEPEMPALPRVRQDEGSAISQEAPTAVTPTPEVAALVPQPEEPAQADIPLSPESPATPEPIQMAKVMPQEPAQAEISTEMLEATLNDVYFDYDRFTIRDDAMPLLKGNAKLLSATLAEKKIVIEGHCDARGTQSYNMVLGEARANAVKTFLQDLGISGEKLQVVSYGKDRPFCMEHTEECFQKNRRGHFVIK